MEEKILKIINQIRLNNQLGALGKLNPEDNLRDDIELNSFDLAELTVLIEDEFDIDIFEDGLVNTIGEIYHKLNNK
jgi:acyl carrier protein